MTSGGLRSHVPGPLGGDVLVSQRTGCAGEPAVDDGVPQRPLAGGLQLDEDRGVAVEVGDGEVAAVLFGEHRFLLVQVLHGHREDRAGGRRGITEPLDVSLAERPLPGEGLAVHEPGAVAVALALGDLGELRDDPHDVVDRCHGATLPTRP